MKYQELYNEYTELLRRQVDLRVQIQALPKGYITKRKIAGREYHYLQCTVNGKKKSECLREERVQEIQEGLVLRDTLQEKDELIIQQLSRLEQAAKILDPDLSCTFYYLKQCAEMDALPVPKRVKALSFAKAMTSLEGLPARPETETQLQQWAEGNVMFADFYLAALEQYRVLQGGQL